MTDTFLVTGATGETGRYTVQRLLEKGHAVRAMVHRQDERADALRSEGAEVVVGDLFEHDDVIRAPQAPPPPISAIPSVRASSRRPHTSPMQPNAPGLKP